MDWYNHHDLITSLVRHWSMGVYIEVILWHWPHTLHQPGAYRGFLTDNPLSPSTYPDSFQPRLMFYGATSRIFFAINQFTFHGPAWHIKYEWIAGRKLFLKNLWFLGYARSWYIEWLVHEEMGVSGVLWHAGRGVGGSGPEWRYIANVNYWHPYMDIWHGSYPIGMKIILSVKTVCDS